jgi:ACS family glucarate transporter-like MFS transporter
VCLDIGRGHAGVVTGCMNTFSNLGGVLTPLVVAYAVERWQSWTFPFYVTAVVYAAGALIWLAIDPEQPIVTQP